MVSDVADVSRTPRVEVLRQLRREVGFGCPVRDCGIPYLTWHHFDPPWREEHHHRPEGMIALCRRHADAADGGAYEDDYLHNLKRNAPGQAQSIRGQLEWMRKEFLAVIGGNFYYRPRTILRINDIRSIWLGRDADGYMLLNVRMPTISGKPRIRIEDNFFVAETTHAEDVVCTAQGRKLRISYPNGDYFYIEFFEVANVQALTTRYGQELHHWIAEKVVYPVTAVEVSERAAGSTIEFGPTNTKLFGAKSGGNIHIDPNCAMFYEVPPEIVERLFPDEGATSTG